MKFTKSPLAIAILLSPSVWAQEPIKLEKIVSTAQAESYRVLESSSATRTNTPLQQTPQSVVVVNNKVIQDQQNLTVSEALQNVSGTQGSPALLTPAFDLTKIRGFVAEQVVDGFTQYTYNPGDRQSLVAVDRIEVLKGANGVLYGGGVGTPVGGLVNLVSKKPEFTPSKTVGIRVGDDNFIQPYVDINQPFDENVAFRVIGEYTQADNEVDFIETKRHNINLGMTVKNDADTQRLTLLAKSSRWRQPEYQGLPATGTITGDFRIDPDLFIGPNNVPDSFSDNQFLTAIYEQKLANNWDLDVRARVSRSEFAEYAQSIAGSDGFTADAPFAPPSVWGLANVFVAQTQNERSFVFNLKGDVQTGAIQHKVLVGADYSNYRDKAVLDAVVGVGIVDLQMPIFPEYVKPTADNPAFGRFFDSTIENQTYGIYAQAQSTIASRLHILTGLRYNGLKIDYTEQAGGFVKSKASENKLLPRVGVVFDLAPELSVFTGYAQGQRNTPFIRFQNNLEPEESEQIEAGLKFNLPHKLSGQFAAYRINREKIAAGSFPLVTAINDQHSQGLELDLVWSPFDKLNVLANYAYTETRIDKGENLGNVLRSIPRNSGRVWVNYDFNEQWQAGAGVYAQSANFVSNNNIFEVDGFARFDATVRYNIENYTISATVKNLANTQYFESYGYFDGRVAPALDRTVYVTAEARF